MKIQKFKNCLISWLMANFNVGKIDRFVSHTPLLNIFYKLFTQLTIDLDFPTHIFVESTSTCNLRCQMCPRTHGNTMIGNMEWKTFKKVIDEANCYGPRNFCLHLFGEPLIAPLFDEMVKYIKSINKQNSILLTTNGTLLTKEKSELLIKNHVDKIAVSFTSPNRKTYLEKTGLDKLKNVEDNVLQLVKSKKQFNSSKPLIFVRMIVENETKNQANDFLKKWKNKGVIAELRDMHNYGGNMSFSNIKNNKRRYPCYHLWLSPALHWNGDVSICCDDYARKAVLGNVKETTIHELWTGDKIKHYRQLHLQGKFDQMPLCGNCDVWNIYSDLFFNWQKK